MQKYEHVGFLLATLNACLNGLSGVALVFGRRAIGRQYRQRHATLMITAFVISTLFLISYLTRIFLTGTHRYPGTGVWKTIYLAILLGHTALACITPPLVIAALLFAWRQNWPKHRAVARVTFPIWLTVSISGVIVYLLLYHPPS